MSKLIFDDIRTTKALQANRQVTVLKSKAKGYSPFSEFGDVSHCDEGSYHLGDCPNLLSDIRDRRVDYQRLVLFSVVEPSNGNLPFIVFFLVKDDDGKWIFPTSRVRRNGSDILNPEILSHFQSSYSRLGFFEDTRYKLPYAVYEMETVASRNGELCGKSLSRGIWVTANEILGESVLGCGICDSVVRFISHTGEGVSRLYKNNRFVPGPRVYYADTSLVKNESSNGSVTLGDLAYAIVKTFFTTGCDGRTDTPNVVLNTSETSGCIVRVAVWDDYCKSDNYELESVVTGTRYSYCAIRTRASTYCIMSSHSGSLTTNSMDASEVLRRKMFIFE